MLKNTFISFLPNSPHRSKPNNSQVWVSRSRQTSHMRKLSEMMSNVTWKNRRQTQPLQQMSPKELKVSQFKNRRFTDSISPHPAAQAASWTWMMRRRTKLYLVGSLLRRRRHTNKETFVGICLCQTSSTTVLATWLPLLVRKW